MIAFAPVVANSLIAVHDECIDTELAETGGDVETCLTCTDNYHCWITFSISRRCVALVEPVRPTKIPGVAFSFGPVPADFLFEALHFLQGCMERPAGCTIRARDEAEYAITAAKRCFELEDRLQALRPGAGDPSRGCSLGV